MRRWLMGVTAVLILITSAWAAIAQSGYAIPWMTIDGGGGQSSGGQYAVAGSIGQADAGELSGGQYGLSGGFWGYPQTTTTPSPTPTATPSSTPTATPTATPTITPLDLTIDKIEITQGIQCLDNSQCPDNSVPLVAGKTTYVRVYVRVNGVSAPVANVSAAVSVLVDGSDYAAIPLNSTITAPLNPSRAQYSHTLNFYLYGDVVNASTRLSARVNPNQTIPERDYGNNTSLMPLNFVTTPKFTIVPIVVDAKNYTTGAMEAVDLSMYYYLSRYAENLLPVSEINWLVLPNPYLKWNNPANPTESDWGKLLAQLNDLRKKNNAALAVDAHYYGMVSTKASHGGIAGYGSIPGKVAAGQTERFNVNLENGADTMVHELGHNFNRNHVNCGNPGGIDSGYPYNVNQIGDFGWDPQIATGGKTANIPNGFVVPQTAADVMSYCQDEWISEYTYQAILNYRGSTPARAVTDDPPEPVNPSGPEQSTMASYLFFSGLLENGQATIFPASILERPSGFDDAPGNGTYQLRLLAADDSLLFERQFNPESLSGNLTSDFNNSADETDLLMFYEVVPWFANTARIEVWQGISLLTDRVVSANPPQVVLAAGAAAWTNSGVYTISWQGSDGDGDALAYDVAFSRDGGQTWQMIATQLITTSLTVNSADFPGTDTAVLRVYATDGILTAEDTGTPFTIADKAPTAVITLPQDNAVFPLNQPVLLKGMAYDWEDGFLDASAFQWQSSLDGDLGAGVEKILTSLSAGSHLITLTVTDSDNRQSTAQIKIYVGSAGTAVFLPVILSP